MSRMSTSEVLEKKVAFAKKAEEARLEEELEYVRFPSIMGWYFDGLQFAVEPFGLNEYYAVYFNNLQEDLDAIAEYEYGETFTEKARRNFWPPKWLGCLFRSRGVYLDFKEIKKDPPQTPPEFNFEPPHNMIGIIEGHSHSSDEEGNEEGNILFGDESLSETDLLGGSGGRGRKLYLKDQDKYYFNDMAGEFERKGDEAMYWFDKKDDVWKMLPMSGPYVWHDYYFDDSTGKYFLRNKSKPEHYFWDTAKNCWKKIGVPVSSNTPAESDYYFDEKECAWLAIKGAPPNCVQDYAAGKRKIAPKNRDAKGGGGASVKGEDDYYYDGNIGQMTLKNARQVDDYIFDPWVAKWRLKNQPYSTPGKGLFPSDYVWNESSRNWEPVPELERYKLTANDYYFDTSGKFLLRDKLKKEDYIFDPVVNIYRRKGAKGKTTNGLGPEDYYYDEASRTWHLVAETQNTRIKLEDQVLVRRKICKGSRGKSGKAPDDFYYDGNDGKFHSKEKHNSKEFYFDFYDEVWHRMGTLDPPGQSGLYPSNYYFDEQTGTWKERTVGRKLIVPAGGPKHFREFHDFYFDYKKGEFCEKDDKKPELYGYNKQDNVWALKTSPGPAVAGMEPTRFYFDETKGGWFQVSNSPFIQELTKYDNLGGHFLHIGDRAKSGNISDDYFFDVEDGKFRLKEGGLPYEFKEGTGAWFRSGVDSNKATAAKPDSFYWDPNEGNFQSKKGVPATLVMFNNNSKLWTRIRRKPTDYHWDDEARKYLLNSNRSISGGDGKKGKKSKNIKVKKRGSSKGKTTAAVDGDQDKRVKPTKKKRGKSKDKKQIGSSSTGELEKKRSKASSGKKKKDGETATVAWDDPNYKKSKQRIPLDRPMKKGSLDKYFEC